MTERLIAVSTSRRARLWIDTLPDATFPSDSIVTRSFTASDQESSVLPAAAIEFVAPTGPRAIYGLLGANFTAAVGKELLVNVSAGGGAEPFLSPLSYSFDIPRVGLLREYSLAAVSGIEEAFRGRPPASGRLSICCAAYSDGSSEALFNRLGFWLVQLMFDDLCRSDDEARQMLSAPLWKVPAAADRNG